MFVLHVWGRNLGYFVRVLLTLILLQFQGGLVAASCSLVKLGMDCESVLLAGCLIKMHVFVEDILMFVLSDLKLCTA